MNIQSDAIRGGILGLIVGDTLGMPVEGQSREWLKSHPVTGMQEYGSHYMPRGTWSDDSSMTLAAMDSITECKDIDGDDMMSRFYRWLRVGEYTPYGTAFGIGRVVLQAFARYTGTDAVHCGGRGIRNNGNGSLMRILPAAFCQCAKHGYSKDGITDEWLAPIHSASAITHAHPISMMGCSLYSAFIGEILSAGAQGPRKSELADHFQAAVYTLRGGYENGYGNIFSDEHYMDGFPVYERLLNTERFKELPEHEMNSGGYVVDTLESALWCFLNTDSYADCVLKAVNLGGDSDTTAAVAGGLAGTYYGFDHVPDGWLEDIRRLEWIEENTDRFIEALYANADKE